MAELGVGLTCSQVHRAVIECMPAGVCVYASVHVLASILARGAGGCGSQIPLLFLGAISVQLSRSLSVCQEESATLPLSCP